MPHQLIEYSANLENDLDITALLEHMHDKALASGMFPIGGTRTRALRRDLYVIADKDPDYGFINIMLRIGTGRSEEAKRETAEFLFNALSAYVADVFAIKGLALSLDIQEIDKSTSFKQNNLHDIIAAKTAALNTEEE
jgi:5-carboxymethyl-2-hydroxymuconate isomerase